MIVRRSCPAGTILRDGSTSQTPPCGVCSAQDDRQPVSHTSVKPKIEQDLIKFFPKNDLKDINHWLVWHGRNTCIARNPKCDTCKLNVFCNYYSNTIDK